MLIVTIAHKNKILLRGNYINLIDTVNTDYFNGTILLQGELPKLDSLLDFKLTLKISFRNKQNRIIVLNKAIISFGNIKFFNENKIDFYALVTYSDDFYAYSQELIDFIFNYWGKEDNRICFTEKQDELYLDTLLLWHGVSESLIPKNKYIFDCSQIKNEADFFIQIGNEIIGERGYFGLNLAAFEDCLCICASSFKEKPTFELRNKDSLSNLLGVKFLNSFQNILHRYFQLV